jgi:IclR family pca regulon transcriptional regulator
MAAFEDRVNMTAKSRKSGQTRGRAPEGMGGLAKGLAILEAFASSDGRLTVADASRSSGTTRASARRCLLTLTQLGYLEFDGKFFRPQPRLLLLSSAYSASRSLPQVAQPVLISARDRLKESVSLAILDNEEAVFVARAEEAGRLVTTGIAVGVRIPAYSSATGRVLLCARDEKELRLYMAHIKPIGRTKHSLTGKGEILDAIRKARKIGYATTDQELEIGMDSIAVPVIDSRGRLVAAMSASASSARVTLQHMVRHFLPVLQEHAATLGRAL